MLHKFHVTTIANATSLAATTSYSFTADHHKVESIQIIWTSTTASFSISIQHSLDGTNWEADGSATSISNSSSNTMYHLKEKDSLYWRVTATRTSGTLDTFKALVGYVPRT